MPGCERQGCRFASGSGPRWERPFWAGPISVVCPAAVDTLAGLGPLGAHGCAPGRCFLTAHDSFSGASIKPESWRFRKLGVPEEGEPPEQPDEGWLAPL